MHDAPHSVHVLMRCHELGTQVGLGFIARQYNFKEHCFLSS